MYRKEPTNLLNVYAGRCTSVVYNNKHKIFCCVACGYAIKISDPANPYKSIRSHLSTNHKVKDFVDPAAIMECADLEELENSIVDSNSKEPIEGLQIRNGVKCDKCDSFLTGSEQLWKRHVNNKRNDCTEKDRIAVKYQRICLVCPNKPFEVKIPEPAEATEDIDAEKMYRYVSVPIGFSFDYSVLKWKRVPMKKMSGPCQSGPCL